MEESHVARRLEKSLCEDERTAELGIQILVRGDRLFAEGQVMSEERRRVVLDVIRELEPDLDIGDQLTVTGEPLEPPRQDETITRPRHGPETGSR